MSWPADTNAALTNLRAKKKKKKNQGGKLGQWWTESKWFLKVTARKKKSKAHAETLSNGIFCLPLLLGNKGVVIIGKESSGVQDIVVGSRAHRCVKDAVNRRGLFREFLPLHLPHVLNCCAFWSVKAKEVPGWFCHIQLKEADPYW